MRDKSTNEENETAKLPKPKNLEHKRTSSALNPETETSKKTKFECKKCSKSLPSKVALRAHYSTMHFKYLLQSRNPDLSDGTKCLKCGKTLASEDLLWMHLGVEHKLVDDIINEECGSSSQTLDDNKVNAKSSFKKPEEASDVNYDLKCQVCGHEERNSSLLHKHVTRHFLTELKEECSSFIKNGTTCRMCQENYKHETGVLDFQTLSIYL